MYGIGALITMASNQNEALTNRIQSESELNEISFYLKYFTSQAINVEDASGSNLNNWPATGVNANKGYIRADYLASKYFVPSGYSVPIDTVAIFLRDTLSSSYTAVPNVGDRFLPTGIYFQKPTAKTFGVLYIDLGQSLAGGNVSISPSRDDLWFGSIVDFQVAEKAYEVFDQTIPDDPEKWAIRRLSAVTFKITVREYLPQENSRRDYTWCPPAKMSELAECATTSPYKDVERIIRVVLRNNILGFSSTQMIQSTTASPVSQRFRRMPFYTRPYDLIYFLKPTYPVGQLKRN